MSSSSAVIDLAAYRRTRRQPRAELPATLPVVMVPVWLFTPVWLVRSFF